MFVENVKKNINAPHVKEFRKYLLEVFVAPLNQDCYEFNVPPGYIHLYGNMVGKKYFSVNRLTGEIALRIDRGLLADQNIYSLFRYRGRINSIVNKTCGCCGKTFTRKLAREIATISKLPSLNPNKVYRLKGPRICSKCKKIFKDTYTKDEFPYTFLKNTSGYVATRQPADIP